MKILSATLKGLKRLRKVSGIDIITITPDNDMSLFLGTNGSGKSTLLMELNPLPGIKKNYEPGGYKRIEVFHQNEYYILISSFTSGQKHSIIKNGIELNESGTLSIQQELVASIFGYTDKIHKLLSGKLNFCRLSATEKKDVLTSINPTDLTYAIEVYERLRVAARDTDGALKHLQKKLTDTHGELLSLDIPEDIEEKVDQIQSQIQTLIVEQHGTNTETEFSEQLSKYQQAIKRYKRLQKEWLSTSNVSLRVGNIDSINELTYQIDTLEVKKARYRERLSSLEQTHSDMESLISEGCDAESIQHQINTTKQKLETVVIPTLSVDVPLCERTAAMLANFGAQLLNITLEGIQVFTADEQKSINLSYANILTQQRGVLEQIRVKEENLKHLKEEKDNQVLCPKCDHKFSLTGMDIDTEIKNLSRWLDELYVDRDNLSIRFKEVSDTKEKLQGYLTVYNQIRILIGQNVPNTHLALLPEIDDLILRPEDTVNLLLQYSKAVEVSSYKSELEEHQEYLEQKFKRLQGKDSNISSKIARIESEVAKTLSKLDNIKVAVVSLMEKKKAYEALQELSESLIRGHEYIDQLITQLYRTAINLDSQKVIKELQLTLGRFQHALELKRSKLMAIETYEKDIEVTKKRQSTLRGLMNSLSPTKGIIGQEMEAFVSSFLNEMNKIISRLWSYDISVLPCRNQKGVLDYRFPFMINGEVADGELKDLSTGQEQIVDFAFMLVMRQYLGLVDYPLYLDETGSGFDEGHRPKLLAYFELLLDTKQCTQIFMVNHYANYYGGIANTDVVVLDDRSITVPSSYNETVSITRG